MRIHEADQYQWVRITTAFFVFLLGAAILAAHLAFLQFNQTISTHYVNAVKSRWESYELPQGRRGQILFRDGSVIATNRKVARVLIDCMLVQDVKHVSDVLSQYLPLTSEEIFIRVHSNASRGYQLADSIDVHVAALIDRENLRGVFTKYHYQRYYPHADYGAAATVGYIGPQPEIKTGLEYTWDERLAGRDGLIKYRKDATRKRLPGSEYETRPKEDGKDVITTLDPAIQLICEDELRESVNRHNPEWACVLVMDPNSGEVLGVATAPTYDPNQYVLGDIQEEFNVLVHRTVEPGSTVKPLLASFAIEHGWVDVSSRFVCNRPLEIDGKILREAVHGTYFGDGSGVSVRKIVTQSSNVGMARIALALGQSRVMQAYQSFGFFRETGIELPLESAGLQPYYYISRNHKDVTWPKRVLANAGFGQGMTVTPLQLATAYSVIANGGYRVTPTLVRKADLPEQDEPSAAPGKLNLPSDETILLASSTPGTAAGFNDGTGRFRVLSKRTVDEITDWLVEVASSDGIGGNAQLARYTAAGKTGTAQIAATQGGYEPGAYTASFVGFFPAEKPQFVVLTMVVRPRGGEYYGGDVAAPLFKKVGDRISYLDQLIPMEEANAT